MAGVLNLTGSLTVRTVGGVVAEARALLNDPAPSSGGSYSGTIVGAGRTLGALLLEVRGLINDTGTPARYVDADLYTYLTDALLTARRFRPDLFVNGNAGGLPVYTTGSASVLFPMDESLYPAFVTFVAATAEMRDDTWVQEGKGPQLLEGFMKNLLHAPYRYDDVRLYAYVSDALTAARGLRPDLFLAAGLLRTGLPAYSPTADSATPFPLDERYYMSVVSYVVGTAMARDAELKPEGPAATYLGLFASGLSKS
jgi:hypothetical protein